MAGFDVHVKLSRN